MTDTAVAPAEIHAPGLQSRPFLPALVVLFIGSGCAALIYEIVWLQMLGLEIGASAISLGVLLGTFMGGMCIGSLLFSRIVSRQIHPLVVYGLLEGAIGILGLLENWLIPHAAGLYVHLASPGAAAIAWRATISGLCLLPPTILMGATLPAISRYVEASPRGVSWMGFFYGGNIVGAVIGCLWAGFGLLPHNDMAYVTKVAMGINFSVAGLAIILSFLSPHEGVDAEGDSSSVKAAPGAWAVYVAIALSGFTGLGAEVVWTRQLSLMLGATVFTFSNILAVFLLGLGIGSSAGAFIARSAREPRAALAWCQLLLAGAIAWAAYSISYGVPFWPVNPGMTDSPFYTFQVNLAACFWALLPGALLWGASFPIALAAIARRGQDPGRLVGGVYAANTVGAIMGSLLFSLIAMPYMGSQGSQQLLIAVCAVSGILAIVPVFGGMMRPEEGRVAASPAALGATLVGLFVAVVVALGLIATVGPPNWGAVAWGRNSASNMPWLFPAVINKPIPLDYLEQQAMDEACKFNPGFKTLNVANGDLVYTVDDGATREQADTIAKFVTDHRTLLVSALQKKAAFSAEYEVVRRANEFRLANARYVKTISLAGGDLRFVPMEGATEKETALNQKFANERGQEFVAALGDQKADLISALKKRLALTGNSSIQAYNLNNTPDRYCVYLGEGMNVSVAVTYDDQGYRYFHGAGKVQASSNPADMRLQRTLGHISALSYWSQTRQLPQDVLVVACGAGVTAGSFVPYGANIQIVDIEQMVPRYVTPQFWDSNHDVIPPEWSGRPTGYKKTKITIDDGRHYIKTLDKNHKFDVITSDPIDPWVKGCAALNTVEYYQMCKEHLKPGGIMALWIPLYESSEETSKSIIATFFKVFPNGIIWANDQNGQGYDCTLFGSVAPDGSDAPLQLDIDAIQDFLDDPAHAAIKRSLQDVHYGDSGDPNRGEAVDLLATFAGTAPRMKEWTKGTENLINTDANLRLQYVAGMGVNRDEAVQIFNHILYNYSWPSEIFVKGKPERMQALKDLLRQTGRIERDATDARP